MNTTKLTREEALRRWNASKETKRKMVEKLETLVRNIVLNVQAKNLLEQKYGSRNIVSRHD